MATRTKRRRRPRKSMWRNKRGRYTRRKAGRRVRYHAGKGNSKKRGWWNPRKKRRARRRRNPAARSNPRRRRRRRNPARLFARNPRKRRRSRRRRNSMYSGRLFARNPRKRRRRSGGRRRRNPFALGGTLGSIKRTLTSPNSLAQFAAAALGGTVSGLLGTALAGRIRNFSPSTFSGIPGQILDAAARIAAGILVASFLPGKYRTAYVLGSGAIAVQPLVSSLVSPALAPVASALGVTGLSGPNGGIGGWISVNDLSGMRGLRGGRGGVGSWLTVNQLPGVGMRGLGSMQQPGAARSAFTM